MKIEKYIKTDCGRNRFHELKRDYNKNIFSKIRLILYVVIASIRDIFKRSS
tara:strand:+ start:269 stop:421 length:153 start_codon:yes stop_codon:yes gene_type:complete